MPTYNGFAPEYQNGYHNYSYNNNVYTPITPITPNTPSPKFAMSVDRKHIHNYIDSVSSFPPNQTSHRSHSPPGLSPTESYKVATTSTLPPPSSPSFHSSHNRQTIYPSNQHEHSQFPANLQSLSPVQSRQPQTHKVNEENAQGTLALGQMMYSYEFSQRQPVSPPKDLPADIGFKITTAQNAEKRIECPHCEKTFAQKGKSYTKHLAIHDENWDNVLNVSGKLTHAETVQMLQAGYNLLKLKYPDLQIPNYT